MPYAKVIDGNVAIASTEIDESWQELVELPEDKMFRGAFVLNFDAVVVDIPLAIELVHDKRRAKRDALYMPVDGGSQYVTLTPAGDAKRLEIKAPDDALQLLIDACTTEAGLRVIIETNLSDAA